MANKLSLNPGEMRALWVGGSCIWETGPLLVLDGVALTLKERAWSLGVLLDPSLLLKAQKASVAKNVFCKSKLVGLD